MTTQRNDLLLLEEGHYYSVKGESSGISLIDLRTKNATRQKLDHGVMKVVFSEVSYCALDGENIYAYHFENIQLHFVRKVMIPLEQKGTHTSGLYTYALALSLPT